MQDFDSFQFISSNDDTKMFLDPFSCHWVGINGLFFFLHHFTSHRKERSILFSHKRYVYLYFKSQK